MTAAAEAFKKMLNAYCTMCGKDKAATLSGLAEKFTVADWKNVTDETYNAMSASLEALSKEDSEATEAPKSEVVTDFRGIRGHDGPEGEDMGPPPEAPPVTNPSLADKLRNF